MRFPVSDLPLIPFVFLDHNVLDLIESWKSTRFFVRWLLEESRCCVKDRSYAQCAKDKFTTARSNVQRHSCTGNGTSLTTLV